MDIKTLEKEALRKGYYLTKAKVNTKLIIDTYEKLEQPMVLSVLAAEAKTSSSSVEKVLGALGAERIKSGKTVIVMPLAKKE